MFRATTPTHCFILPFDTGLLKNFRITYRQFGKTVLQKTEADCNLTQNTIKTQLTQQETLLFAPTAEVSIQLRVVTTEGSVMASDIMTVSVAACLDEEVLACESM